MRSSVLPRFDQALRGSGLQAMHIKGRRLLPIVQGGMGVGVSAHRLSAAVAHCGAMGTISSIDLRRLHPDLMHLTTHLPYAPENKAIIDQANVQALKREITMAKSLSHGFGMIAVNIMRAVNEYAAYVPLWWVQACHWICLIWRWISLRSHSFPFCQKPVASKL